MVDSDWGRALPSMPAQALELVFLVDVSGSMATGGKIQSLNTAVEEALPSLRQVVSETVERQAFVRVLAFGSSVRWVVDAPQPLPTFWWPELHAEPQGFTELGAALDLLKRTMEDRGNGQPYPLILLTDGMPTDTITPSFEQALALLNDDPSGLFSSRVAVAVGRDADRSTLESFVRPVGGRLLTAQEPQQLAAQIRLAGSTVIRSATELAQ